MTRKGDEHYDTISAFIKSMRASQPDAAMYYLARMVEAGEDPLFIARRMVFRLGGYRAWRSRRRL
jgi:putative ATPase